jgi:hypothetical protein
MFKKQHTENELIREMRNVYKQRLSEALRDMNEVEVHDKQGKIIVSPGLKVRHKKSKFEYTVHSVNTSNKTINLLSPEAPRFETKPSGASKMKTMPDEELLSLMNSKIDIPADLLLQGNSEDSQDDEILNVSFAEFTKKYEVTE